MDSKKVLYLIKAWTCQLTSFSKYLARMAIWFSFWRRASRDRLAAMLFFRRLAQYLSSFSSSGTNCFLDFLIIGWGFNSSSENARVRGSKSRPDDANENAGNRISNGFSFGKKSVNEEEGVDKKTISVSCIEILKVLWNKQAKVYLKIYILIYIWSS